MVAGKPTPTVSWYRDDKLISNRTVTVRNGVARNELVIKNLGRNDVRSTLTCNATNNNRSIPLSSTVYVDMNCKYYRSNDLTLNIDQISDIWGYFHSVLVYFESLYRYEVCILFFARVPRDLSLIVWRMLKEARVSFLEAIVVAFNWQFSFFTSVYFIVVMWCCSIVVSIEEFIRGKYKFWFYYYSYFYLYFSIISKYILKCK